MNNRRNVLLGLAALSAAPRAWAEEPAKALFNGKDLAGWSQIGEANWRVEDGAIVADHGKSGYLVSKDDYRDFDLTVEFWVSPEANSGVFIRCSDRSLVNSKTAYEVNIFDTRPDPSYGTGAIVDVAKVDPMPKAGGRWNVMQISAHGDRFSVTVDGRKTVDAARDGAHAGGAIALQYGAGVVKFRRVEIRPAQAGA